MSKVIETCTFIAGEVTRATVLHAPFPTHHHAYAVILEELDEYWEEVKTNPRKLTPEQRDERRARIEKELLHVAAMAVRTICDLDGHDV